jgi:hypothetical protein
MTARFLFALLLAAPALPQQPPYLYVRQLDKAVSNNTRSSSPAPANVPSPDREETDPVYFDSDSA